MKPSRRHFLTALGGSAALSFAPSLARALLRDALVRAEAEANGLATSRYYINMQLGAAPNRVYFDQWLRTNADDPQLIANPMASTAFTYNSSTRQVSGVEYKTLTHNNVEVPFLFASLSPADREAFLSQFLVIRGYGSGQDGHIFNSAIQLHPLASAPSISAFLADQSDKQFKAIQSPGRGAQSRFVSRNNVGLNLLNIQAPLDDLLKPLAGTITTARALRNANQTIISDFRAFLKQNASSEKALKIATGNLESVYQLMGSMIGDYSSTWTTLVNNYQSTMEAAARASMVPGLSATYDNSASISATSDGTAVKYAFDVNSVGAIGLIANGREMNQVITNIDLLVLAKSFALADFCISNDLVSTIELRVNGISGLRRDPSAAFSAANSFYLDNDMHGTGSHAALVAVSSFFRGYTNGLLQLKQNLSAAGKWSNTIFHTVSDFSRSFRMDGSGSDHGFNAMASSVFSGVFQGGPYVVGNIERGSAATGTQGTRALIANYPGGQLPTPITMASTVSRLMGISENPWNNLGAPLISLNNNGTLNLPFGKGRVIA